MLTLFVTFYPIGDHLNCKSGNVLHPFTMRVVLGFSNSNKLTEVYYI